MSDPNSRAPLTPQEAFIARSNAMNVRALAKPLENAGVNAVLRLENLTQKEKNFLKYDIPLIIDIQIKILKNKKIKSLNQNFMIRMILVLRF